MFFYEMTEENKNKMKFLTHFTEVERKVVRQENEKNDKTHLKSTGG
jgi:hypothetical protein